MIEVSITKTNNLTAPTDAINHDEITRRSPVQRPWRGIGMAAGICGLLLASSFQAFAAQATGIQRPKAGETVEVLVQYAAQPTEEQHRRITAHNGRIRATFEHVPVAH